MANITLLTGGQRSGKSSYAQTQAEEASTNPIYIATARIWDKEFEKRIIRHQKDRGAQWTNIEEEKSISRHNLTGRTVLLDCITLWLTNIFCDNCSDVDLSLEEAKKEWDKFTSDNFDLYVVTNEIGMGVIPESYAGRKFADLQGWMNQYIASKADRVVLMVSGIPVTIK